MTTGNRTGIGDIPALSGRHAVAAFTACATAACMNGGSVIGLRVGAGATGVATVATRTAINGAAVLIAAAGSQQYAAATVTAVAAIATVPGVGDIGRV